MTAILAGEPFVGTRIYPCWIQFEFAVIDENGNPNKLGHCTFACGAEHDKSFWAECLKDLDSDNEQTVVLFSTTAVNDRPEVTLKINKQTNVFSWRVPSLTTFEDASIACLPLKPFAPALRAALERVHQFFAARE